MIRSWKSKLGASLSTLGKSLMGIGVLPQLSGEPNSTLTYIAMAGFILDAAGGFFRDLFSADKTSVVKMIEQSGGDTAFFKK
jgi:hypothetical protein